MRGGSPLEGGALSHLATAPARAMAQASVLLTVLGDREDGLPLLALRSWGQASPAWQGDRFSGAGASSPRSDGELRSYIWGQSRTLFKSGFLKERPGGKVGN